MAARGGRGAPPDLVRRRRRGGLRLAASLFAGLLSLTSGAAQAAAPSQGAAAAVGLALSGPPSDLDPAPVAAFARNIDLAETRLDAISFRVRAPRLSDTDLRRALASVPPIESVLGVALDNLEPRLKSADARLAQLGPPPGPGQPPEDPETARSRQEILRYRQSVDVEVKQAKLLETEADQLTSYLKERRRRLFTDRLSEHGPSILDPRLWSGFAGALPADAARLATAADGEAALLAQRAGSAGAGLTWAMAALALALGAAAARLGLDRVGEAWLGRPTATRPSGTKDLLTLWWVLAAGLVPLMAGLAIQGAFGAAGALTPLAAEVVSLAWKSVVYGALLEALARALLAPGHPMLRAAPLSDEAARRLTAMLGLVALCSALGGFAAGLDSLLGASPPTKEGVGYLVCLLQLVAVLVGLGEVGRARVAWADANGAADRAAPGLRLAWPLAAMLAWLAAAAAGVAMLAGYLSLATFLVRQLVWSAAIIAAVFLLMRAVDAGIAWVLSPARPLGRGVRISIGLSPVGVAQLSELLSGIARLGLLLAGWAAILAPLGADAQDVFGRITSTDMVLKLGQLTVSPGALAGAVVVFAAGLAATQILKRWLESRYLPKTRMDVGVRASLAAGVTYVGVFVAVLLACADLGLSLDRIALLASALTVGIGFGLQAVIGNFVSGLIILAERRVKVGDWVAIGDMEGDVRRISVRATEIEMGDRSRLIVPNADLVSKMVRNVTHGGASGLVKIVLRLAADSDPVALRELLLKHLRACPEALAQPPPAVYITDVKDGALEVTALVSVPSPRQTFKAKSDLLFQIVPDLRANGFALAGPGQVVKVEIDANPPAGSSSDRTPPGVAPAGSGAGRGGRRRSPGPREGSG